MSKNSISGIVHNVQYFSGPKVNDHKLLMPVDKDDQISRIKRLAGFAKEKSKEEKKPIDLIIGNEFQEKSSVTHDVPQLEILLEELKKQGLGDFHHISLGGFNLEEPDDQEFWDLARKVYENDFVREKILIPLFGFGNVQIPDRELGPVRLHTKDVIISRYPISEETHEYFFPEPKYKRLWYWNFITQQDERQGITSCKIRHPAFEFIVHALHLQNAKRKHRRKQADKVCKTIDHYLEEKFLEEKPDMPQLIAGDFNSDPEGIQKYQQERGIGSFERIIRHYALHCFPGIYPTEGYTPSLEKYATYPSLDPKHIFDSVLLHNFQFLKYEVCRIGISDHEPVYFEVEKT